MLTDTNKDYRNTTNCPVLVDVALKKCALERKIQQDHKRAKRLWPYLRYAGAGRKSGRRQRKHL